MNLTVQETKEWLKLALSENVGPITFRNLIAYFGTPKEAIGHLDEFARRGGRTKPIVLATDKMVNLQLKKAEETDAEILPLNHPDYPKLLKTIEDAPPILYVKGHLTLTGKTCVGIVGTRGASLNGKNFTRKLAADLSKADFTVISGMAKGIDSAAHQGALSNTDGKGGTVAVIGTGLDDVYPKENKALCEELFMRGCVISELPFGSPIAPQNFPRRNRIISGLSKGIVVIEAELRSGSLITARLAKEQNRHVFAVPGFPLEPRSEGPNRLLKNGAGLVEKADDIIDTFDDLTRSFQMEEPAFEQIMEPYAIISESDLAKARKIVIENLSPETTGINDLIGGTGLSAQLVNIILVELELAGRIERFPGNRVSLLAQIKE